MFLVIEGGILLSFAEELSVEKSVHLHDVLHMIVLIYYQSFLFILPTMLCTLYRDHIYYEGKFRA